MGLGTPLVTPTTTPLLLPQVQPFLHGAKQRQQGMPCCDLRSLHAGERAATVLLTLASCEISSDPHPEQQPINHALKEAVPRDCPQPSILHRECRGGGRRSPCPSVILAREKAAWGRGCFAAPRNASSAAEMEQGCPAAPHNTSSTTESRFAPLHPKHHPCRQGGVRPPCSTPKHHFLPAAVTSPLPLSNPTPPLPACQATGKLRHGMLSPRRGRRVGGQPQHSAG